VRVARDIYTSPSLIFNFARGRRGRQQNRKRCSQDADQDRCAAREIHAARTDWNLCRIYLVCDHKTREPRAGSERVPHLSLDTAVQPLTSAPFPRRADGNWPFALPPRERARFLTSASWVQTKTWVKVTARLTRAGLMPAKICAALIVMRANLPGPSGRSAKPGDCTV